MENLPENKQLELQMLGQQIQQIQQQMQSFEHQIGELRSVHDSVEEMSKTKEGTEVLIPLGSGVFVKGEIKDSKNLVMGVGSKVIIEKPAEHALEVINSQISEIEKVIIQIESELIKLTEKAQGLQMEMLSSQKE